MTRLMPGMVAVVTGGGAGIGYALAEAFAARGLRIVLADRDERGLHAAKERLEKGGAEVLAVMTDVADRASVRALREASLSRFGRVDVLCNNAGVYPGMQPLWTIDPEAWRKVVDVNFWGVVHGLQEFVPLFIAQNGGHVVNTASMSGLSTVPGSADYGGTKHAVVAISETLRTDLDLAGHGEVGVTILCPSLVMTDMGRRALGVFNASGTLEARGAIGSGPNLSAAITPETLAAKAVEGIEEGRLYVLPTPFSRDRFLKRIQPILSAFDAYPETRGEL